MSHLPSHRGFNGGSLLFFAGSGSYHSLSKWDGNAPMDPNSQEYSTDLFGSKALEAVEKHDAKKPLFLYLPFQAVHTPYDLPPRCKKPGLCDANPIRPMLQDADAWVGKIVSALKSKGMYDDTLIFFSADNGGVTDGNNYPLRGEKHTNWQGGMRTASFISGGYLPESMRGERRQRP